MTKKGITPIIAIIILLLITIALAGAAYSYISVYWSSITGRNIQVVTGFCTSGNIANIIIRNIGTLDVILADVQIIDTATSQPASGDWTTIDGTQEITALNPGITGKFNATCSGYCTYRFIYGGAVGTTAQPISIAC